MTDPCQPHGNNRVLFNLLTSDSDLSRRGNWPFGALVIAGPAELIEPFPPVAGCDTTGLSPAGAPLGALAGVPSEV